MTTSEDDMKSEDGSIKSEGANEKWDIPAKRKVQICCLEDKFILSVYWRKIAKPNDEIMLVHIIKDTATEEEAKSTKTKILDAVGEFVEQCTQNMIKCENIFHVGKPAEGICEVAMQYKPHLLVVGTKGTNKRKRATHKSISSYVVHNSAVPILVVPMLRGHIRQSVTAISTVAQTALMLGVEMDSKSKT